MRFARIYDDAVSPTRKHSTDAGIDFYAHGDYVLHPVSYKIINTGVTVEIPDGYFGLLKPKGRNNHLVGAGVIDQDYQGEVMVKLFNPTSERYTVRHGQPIAQLIILPCVFVGLSEVPLEEIHQEETERGTSGGIHGQEA